MGIRSMMKNRQNKTTTVKSTPAYNATYDAYRRMQGLRKELFNQHEEISNRQGYTDEASRNLYILADNILDKLDIALREFPNT